MNNILLVETKKEYTKSLCLILQPQILKGIRSIFLDAQRLSNHTNSLRSFQKLLEGIPKWDRTTLTIECERIVKSSNCSYLHELITAVFVCYTKVLTAVQVGDKKASVDIDIPSTETFVHKCYIEAARRFWKEPYLLSANVTTMEYQRNLRHCEKVINESIDETIRGMLPIQHIMQQYLRDNDCASSVSSQCTDRTDKTDATLTTLRDIIRNNITMQNVPENEPIKEDTHRVTITPTPPIQKETYNYTTQQYLNSQIPSDNEPLEADESSHDTFYDYEPRQTKVPETTTPTMTIHENKEYISETVSIAPSNESETKVGPEVGVKTEAEVDLENTQSLNIDLVPAVATTTIIGAGLSTEVSQETTETLNEETPITETCEQNEEVTDEPKIHEEHIQPISPQLSENIPETFDKNKDDETKLIIVNKKYLPTTGTDDNVGTKDNACTDDNDVVVEATYDIDSNSPIVDNVDRDYDIIEDEVPVQQKNAAGPETPVQESLVLYNNVTVDDVLPTDEVQSVEIVHDNAPTIVNDTPIVSENTDNQENIQEEKKTIDSIKDEIRILEQSLSAREMPLFL